MLDPTSNFYLETNGVPLNAWEIRQEWFYWSGTNLTFVVGADRKRYQKADLPIRLKTFPKFGELAIHPDELDKYGFIGYIPNTDLLDSGFDYGKMFIVKDPLCDGTKWHTRKLPEAPGKDPYFPLGETAIKLTERLGKVQLALETFTPNLKGYEARFEAGAWKPVNTEFEWPLHKGLNRLAVRTVNHFGVTGPTAVAVIEVKE